MADYAKGIAALRQAAATSFAGSERDLAKLRQLFVDCDRAAECASTALNGITEILEEEA